MPDIAERIVYMDYAATTPVDPRVAAAMAECLTLDGSFGNASSTGHRPGAAARRRVEEAREQVAQLIGAEPASIVWTSGATESNNLAILGAARYHRDRGTHVITAKTEHKAVLDPCRQLEKEGFRVTYLRPDRYGIVAPDQVAEALTPDTVLVSIMHVNNEIGVIQDIEAIGRSCRERDVLLHVDGAQSVGKIPVDCRFPARRSAVLHGAQVLRAQGQWCALRSASAAPRARAAHVRRRAGGRRAIRNSRHPPDRRARRGVCDCERGTRE